MISPSSSREGWIAKLIDFSVKYKGITLLFTAVVLAVAIWSIKNIPLDAIPDLSDTQVIIYSRWDRSADIIEDQVTYPIVSALLGAPQVKAIRGFSDYGFSYIYVIFKDGTDIYWARSRTLEYLSKIQPQLPQGVKTELGPDATGVGWVFQYALVDTSGTHDLKELRSFQDWNLKYHLQSVPGVAEVASIGGFVKQYQVTVDPGKLLLYHIPLTQIVDAVRKNNSQSSGRLLEISGAEFMVRANGYVKSSEDLENTVVALGEKGTPVLLKHVAHIAVGSDMRRGIADLNGQGDTVGGTVIMRFGENALNVIHRVKEKLVELESTLPKGVKVIVTYDRSDLILRAIDQLKHSLTEEIVIVSLVILLFLWHFPSAFIPIITIPIAVLLSFIPLSGMKLTSNIMSLSGIAISIGVLVDGAIVQMENIYKRLEEWELGGQREDPQAVCLKAMKEVGPSVFFSLLVIAVSFLPIFTLVDQEGRLFRPLAWSKTWVMAIAAILIVTLNPAIRMLFLNLELKARLKNNNVKPLSLSQKIRAFIFGRYIPEEKHPVSRVLCRIYEPVCRFVLEYPKRTIAAAVCIVLLTVPIYMRLGSEFMPPLWEGDILYMPTTMPGISVTQAGELMKVQDRILKQFPEVKTVFGKAGRIESSTDPAPFSMMETVVMLKPVNEWRLMPRFYSKWPDFLKPLFNRFWPEHITHEELVNEMDTALNIPGQTNAWTMPIKNRIDMLSTGVRTPIGIKILGDNFKAIENIGIQIEMALKNLPGTRSIFAERTSGGYYLDVDFKRDELARFGISLEDAQMTLSTAIGGENISETIEGRERYGISVRYQRGLRQDIEDIKKVLVMTPSSAQVPLSQLAKVETRFGPSMIRDENGMLAGYVYVDVSGSDIGSYVNKAKALVAQQIQMPTGYSMVWSGQYENMFRVRERLKIVLPLTIFLIGLLLYMNTHSFAKTLLVLLAVPFSLVGAVWFLWILGYNMSIAVWVGLIALMGLDAETGVLMLLFLDLACQDAKQQGRLENSNDLKEALIHGAVRRLRPKVMTVMAAMMGLLPIMWSVGSGSDVMKRIAAPMIGGLVSSFILELLVYPAIYMVGQSVNPVWDQRTKDQAV